MKVIWYCKVHNRRVPPLCVGRKEYCVCYQYRVPSQLPLFGKAS